MTKLDGSDVKTPPRTEEVEVSIFGPGFGECIVVHLTQREWLVVDSCLDVKTKEPAALAYFQKIGVDPGSAIRYVISTHWHDDHVRGIGQTFERAKSARFACAHALRNDQFKALQASYSRFWPASGSGVAEFTDVIAELKSRRKTDSRVSPFFVSEGTILYQRDSSNSVFVKALSPSSETFQASVARFSEFLVPKTGQRRSVLPSLQPNDLAIVLTVKVDDIRVLLGADLEEAGSGYGWQAVLDGYAHTDNSHHGFKIPHHGSSTGHHAEVWPRLMAEDAWSALTPYSNGRTTLPQAADVARICSLSRHSYITAKRSVKTYRHPDSAVQRQLREMGITVLEENSEQGHVRFRKITNDPTGDWTVELFGDACRLSDLKAN
jgi:hypothetical protein